MTVDTSISFYQSAGDGVTTSFGFPAPVQQPSDLTVELVDAATGAVTAQVLDTDYAVTIAADGLTASVIFNVAPPIGQNVNRRRNADYKQPISLPANGPLPNEAIEEAVDRLIFQLQAIRDQGNRGIRLADSDPPSLAALPPLASMAGMYLWIDLAGNPGATSGPAGAPVSGAMTPVVGAVTLAAALGLLGFSAYVQTLLGTASLAAMRTSLGILVERSYLAGLNTSNNVGTPNTKVDVTAGMCADSTNTAMLVLAAGTVDCGTVGANGLDAGALANTTCYHLFAIGKADGTTAFLASTSVSAPAMPTGYTLKRRIASFRTDGSAHILAYIQDGDFFQWSVSVTDVSEVCPSGSPPAAVLKALSVPIGISVVARLLLAVGFPDGVDFALVKDPATSDEVPSSSNFQLKSLSLGGGAAPGAEVNVRTDTSGRVRYRFSHSSGTNSIAIRTLGWIDRRGRDD